MLDTSGNSVLIIFVFFVSDMFLVYNDWLAISLAWHGLETKSGTKSGVLGRTLATEKSTPKFSIKTKKTRRGKQPQNTLWKVLVLNTKFFLACCFWKHLRT